MNAAYYVLAIAGIWAVYVIVFIVWSPPIHGQDADPRYACFKEDQFPFRQLCIMQEQQRLEIIKEVCQNDESFCVLGIPDPDFKDDGHD